MFVSHNYLAKKSFQAKQTLQGGYCITVAIIPCTSSYKYEESRHKLVENVSSMQADAAWKQATMHTKVMRACMHGCMCAACILLYGD